MRFFLFLLLISTRLRAQESDTLLARILQLDNDTEKVNQLYAHGVALRNSDPKLALYYANLCEERAQIAESPKHLAKSYNLLGILYYKRGDFKKTLAYHQKALELREECKDIFGAALSRVNLGNAYTDLQFYEKAEEHYLKALETFGKVNDDKRAADCLMNLGVLKQTLKQNQAAYENYSQALILGEKLNDYEIRARCLNNIAQIFFEKEDYGRSIAFNEDALKIRSMMDNNVEVADSYLNLASNYIKLKQPEKARGYIDTAIVISKNYDYFEALLLSRKINSDYYSELHQYDLAYDWLKKYMACKDSLLLEQNLPQAFDFDLPEVLGHAKKVEKGLHNTWLLISVLVFAIFVPFILIRLKR
jgi:tetratricopeptide (TPR) repeat protein